MKFLFKVFGIVLVFLCVAFLGLFKSFSKRDYIRRLKKTVSALEKADNMLRTGATKREKILSKSFEDAQLLNIPESDLLNAFFRDFGSGDLITEHKRIQELKKELLAEICREEAEYAKSGRLWRTAGVCGGLAVCIMLI